MSSASPIQMVPDAELIPTLIELPYMNAFYSEQVMATQAGLSVQVPHMDVSDSVSDTTSEDDKVYTSLSDPKKSLALTPLTLNRSTSTDSVDMRSWRERHPKHWDSKDIIHWIYFVCSRSSKLDCYKIRGENFNGLRGDILCGMTRKDFLKLEPTYGADLYDCFSKLLETAQFKAPEYADLCLIEDMPHTLASTQIPSPTPLGDSSAMWSSTIPPEERDQEMDLSTCSMMPLDLDPSLGQPGTGVVFIGDKQYDYISDDGFEDIQTPHNSGAGAESGYGSDESTCNSPREGFPQPPPAHSNHPPVTYHAPYQVPLPPMGAPMMSPRPAHVTQHDSHVFHQVMSQPPTTTPTGKQRGRPRRDNTGTTGSTRGRKQGQTTKGNHLWEFIRDTINDARYNPDCIKWENKEQGIFRIVNSGEIARMWGRTKNNASMTYEKFSRAMRFCRTQSFFAELPKGGNYPKKLCFRFGSKATNWAH